MHLRLIEDPLGSDADKLPTLADVEALIAVEFRKPVPDYSGTTLRRFLADRAKR